MPLTDKGETIKKSLVEQYGEKKGTSILYAGKNKGTFTGIDSTDAYAPGQSMTSELGKENTLQHAANTLGKGKSTLDGRRRFTAAFRDCTRKGMSFDQALASSLASTTKDEEPIEGAREVFNSIFELHNKIVEHGEHGEHGAAHGAGHAPGGHAPAGHAAGAPAHNVHGAGTPAPAAHAPKAPAVSAPTKPHVPPIPKAAAPTAPKAVAPKVAAPATSKAATPAAPTAPKVAASAAPPAPRATSPKVKVPPTKDSTMRVYHKDAAARFRATVRDAVRENMPLPKVMELGVISGTASNGKTPDSDGPEYKPTKDAFTAAFRDAVKKGVSTTDALRTALKG